MRRHVDNFSSSHNYGIGLALSSPGGEGGGNNPLLSQNYNFSRIQHLVDLRPIFKLKFVHFGPVQKKKQSIHLSFVVAP